MLSKKHFRTEYYENDNLRPNKIATNCQNEQASLIGRVLVPMNLDSD